MKRVLCLGMAAILILALGACACEHQWQSADCVNPQSCEKCGEVQGEALGHSFQAASCTAPETCSLCGETRGEALDHQFGPWSFEEESMSRICTVCSSEEKTAIDRQIQFDYLLAGHWDMYSMVFGPEEISIDDIPGSGLDHSLNYEPGGKLMYRPHNPVTGSGAEAMELSFELESYDESSGCFYAHAQAQSGEEYRLELINNGKEWLLYVKTGEGDSYDFGYGFSRYEKTRPAMIGFWMCSDRGSAYGLELFDDGSFKLQGGRELQGNWQMMPGRNGRCRMIYSQDGKSRLGYCQLSTDVGYGSSLMFDTPDGLSLFMDKAEREDFDEYARKLNEGEAFAVGDWDSTSSYSYLTGIAQPLTGCKLSINADGSFTISGAKSLEGTWKYDNMQTDESGCSYYYTVYYPGGYFDGSMMTVSDKGSISFPFKGEDGKYFYINFHRFSAEQWEEFEKGPELLSGEYVSKTLVTEDGEREDDSYTLTVHENGTLSGNIIEDISGTWQYYDYSAELNHLYYVEIDKSLIKGTMSLREDGVFVLRFRLEGGEDMKIHFVRK